MATQSQTLLEFELLDHDSNKSTLKAPVTALCGPANTMSGQPGAFVGVESNEPVSQPLPKGRAVIVTIQLAGINFITSFSSGLVTVGLPAMSSSLNLPRSLLLWPMNSYALTSGACLLLAGAVADVIGTKRVNLTGCFFIALFMMVSGFSQTGIQLIMFRAMQGIGGALALPSSMSIISKTIESGKPRNIAFACLGLAMPLGFSFGLVLAGVFIAGPGWRVGFYVGAAASFLLFAIGIWALPPDVELQPRTSIRKRLAAEIDWLGAGIACTFIAVFSYVLA